MLSHWTLGALWTSARQVVESLRFPCPGCLPPDPQAAWLPGTGVIKVLVDRPSDADPV